MDEDLRDRIALFRYGVISDLVTRTLSPGEKERLLAEISEKEWDIPGTPRRKVGRSTARNWVDLYRAHGFEGLKPLVRKDAGSSRGIPDETQDLLLRLLADYPTTPFTRLIDLAHQAAPVGTGRVSYSTAHRFLKGHTTSLPSDPSASPDARAFTHEHINDLWMCDVMHGPRLVGLGRARGERTYLIAVIDDASRLITHAAFYRSEGAACLIDVLRRAFLRRGIPRRFYCDNGSAFRTRHLELVCAILNVTLIHSRPHQPRGRGKIERFFRTVRARFLTLLQAEHLQDLDVLNRVFSAWLEGEYHVSAHGGLDGETPLDRFLEDTALIRSAPEDLERLMRMTVTRRVAKDRTVRLDGRVYEAPDGYAGERVDVLYDPYDTTTAVHLRRCGEREEVRLRLVDPIANSRLRPPVTETEEPETEEPLRIPTEVGHRFRFKSATYSDASRPSIPIRSRPLFEALSELPADMNRNLEIDD